MARTSARFAEASPDHEGQLLMSVTGAPEPEPHAHAAPHFTVVARLLTITRQVSLLLTLADDWHEALGRALDYRTHFKKRSSTKRPPHRGPDYHHAPDGFHALAYMLFLVTSTRVG
jgi:hypothetical protein